MEARWASAVTDTHQTTEKREQSKRRTTLLEAGPGSLPCRDSVAGDLAGSQHGTQLGFPFPAGPILAVQFHETLGAFDCLLEGLQLEYGEAADHFLGFGKGAVDGGDFAIAKLDAGALGGRQEAAAGNHRACFGILRRKRGNRVHELLGREAFRLAVMFDNHHISHVGCSFFQFCRGQDREAPLAHFVCFPLSRRTGSCEIDTRVKFFACSDWVESAGEASAASNRGSQSLQKSALPSGDMRAARTSPCDTASSTEPRGHGTSTARKSISAVRRDFFKGRDLLSHGMAPHEYDSAATFSWTRFRENGPLLRSSQNRPAQTTGGPRFRPPCPHRRDSGNAGSIRALLRGFSPG